MGDEIETTRSVMGDEIETTRSATPISFGSRTRTTVPISFGSRTRTTVPISFGSRTRSVLGGSVLGGDNLDGDASAGVRSQYQWRTAAARSRKREIGTNGGKRQLDRVGVGLPK